VTTPVRFAIVGIAALAIALVAWSVGAESPEEARNRQAIANKSEAEREILRRRYESFLKMPSEEREAIRRLHEATQSDPGLTATLNDYESFVSHLELWDQQELREIKDPSKRVAQVRRLIADRSAADDHRRPSWLTGRGSERFTFSPPNFDEAMSIVEGLLSFSAKEKSELENLDKPHRHLRVAESAANRFHTQPKWPDKADFERLATLLPNDGYRDMLLGEKIPDEFRRNRLAYSLMKGLVVEWEGVVREHIPVEAFRDALGQMKEDDQWEVSRHDPDRLMYEIMKGIANSDDEIGNYAKDFIKAAKLKAGFDLSFGRRPGGWSTGGRGDRGGPGPDRGRGPGSDGPPPNFRDGGPRFGDGRGGPGSGRSDGRQRNRDFDPPHDGPPPGDRPRPPE